MPGYDSSRISHNGKELDDLICCICLGVFRNPVVTLCCRHTYCEGCIEQWLSQCKTCPIDRKGLTKEELEPVPGVLINYIDDLKIKCDYESDGCTQVVRIGELANHLMVCNFGPKQFCKTCGLFHNCIQSLICEKQKSDQNYLKLLNQNEQTNLLNSSLMGIVRENSEITASLRRELAQSKRTVEDLSFANYKLKFMLALVAIIITAVFIGFCLFQFLYVKQYNEMIDTLGGDLAQFKSNHKETIPSVKLKQNETIDSLRRELAQSISNQLSSIGNERLKDLFLILPIVMLIVVTLMHLAYKPKPVN